MKKALPWILCIVALFIYPPAFLPFTEGKWLALWLAGLFSLAYLLRAPVIFPNFSKAINAFFGLILVGMLAQLFWARPQAFLFVVANRLSFFLVALGFWKAFRRGLGPKDFWAPLALGLFFTSLGALIRAPGPGGFFGDANLAAEAVAFLFVALWRLSPPERTRPLILRSFLFLSFTLGSLFLFLQAAGWLLLAVALALALTQSRGANDLKSWPSRLPFASLGLGLSLAILVSLASGALPRAVSSPLIAGSQFSLWKHTLLLAQANPLGVGPERFEFASLRPMAAALGLPEGQRILSPGNEALRYLAEDGLPLTLAYAAAWGLLLALYRRRNANLSAWAYAPLIFLGLSCFALPLLQNALVVAALAALWGLMASEVSGEGRIRRPLAIALFRFNVSVVVGCIVGAAVLSRSFEAQASRAALACQITPANWRACLLAGHELQANGDFQAARYFVEGVLAGEPDNLLAQQRLVFIAGNQRRNLEACFLLWRFDDFYGGKSSQHERLLKNCRPKWLEYFAKKRPTRFYERQKKMPTGF
ncbi:MAG: hypothetical protein EOP11_10760 [Proteobacteria bacterium]|nr:MAG: hypothetical protein EOP11_10760 [Pseudomonadota bacterium]